MDEKAQKDYARLIAAQNECARRLKIKSISNTLSEENKKKGGMAILSGLCISGLIVATHFSGVDPKQALAIELEALNSFEALKEYFSMFTPAMWGTLLATAGSLSSYINHKRKYDKANQEDRDMMATIPKDYQDIVEYQAKSR